VATDGANEQVTLSLWVRDLAGLETATTVTVPVHAVGTGATCGNPLPSLPDQPYFPLHPAAQPGDVDLGACGAFSSGSWVTLPFDGPVEQVVFGNATVALYGRGCGGPSTPACNGSPVFERVGRDARFFTPSSSLNIVSALLGEGALCDLRWTTVTCAYGGQCRPGADGRNRCSGLPACANGRDDDGNGRVDYPEDPGCAWRGDVNEGAAAGGSAPVCSNGVDDDGDTATDWPADPACGAAAGASEAFCSDPIKGVLGSKQLPVTVTGRTAGGGAASRYAGTCAGSNSPEDVWEFVAPFTGTFQFDTYGSAYQAVVYVRADTCTGRELGCSFDSSLGTSYSSVSVNLTKGAVVSVFVDGYSFFGPASGDYRLTARARSGSLPPGYACTPGDAAFVCGEGTCLRGPLGAFVCALETPLVAGEVCVPGDEIHPCGDGAGSCSLDTSGGHRCGGTLVLSNNAECVPGAVGYECGHGSCRNDGAGVYRCVAAACSDGLDNDGDGKVDYPNDPGCPHPEYDSEVDPGPRPLCGNGLDDDADGNADWPPDAGCGAASGESESFCSAATIAGSLGRLSLPIQVSGDTSGGTTALASYSSACPAAGPEQIWEWAAPYDGQFDFRVTSGEFSPIVSVRSRACTGGEVVCSKSGSATAVSLARGQLVAIVVEGGRPLSRGRYALEIAARSLHLLPGDPCDPANDQCSIACDAGPIGSFCRGPACWSLYPLAAGCATPYDADATVPTPAPVCADLYPASAPSCGAASGKALEFCATPIAGVLGDLDLPITVAGPVGPADEYALSCNPGRAPEAVYEWTAPAEGWYRVAATGVNGAAVEVLGGSCTGASLACSASRSGSSAVEVRLGAGQTVAILVEPVAGMPAGWASLSISSIAPPPLLPDDPCVIGGEQACSSGYVCTSAEGIPPENVLPGEPTFCFWNPSRPM
jgi:hypothetical protein